MSRLVFALMWLVHWLPMGAIAAVGNLVGDVTFWLIPERRKVTRINLAKCFPQLPAAERERLARAHFRAFMRSFVEHALLWWAPRERIMRLIRVEGLERLRALAGQPVILVAPHFVGLDAAYTRLGCEIEIAGLYARQKNPVYDRLLLRGRTRFGLSKAIPRQDGVRAVIASIRSGLPFYYAPDLDFGRKDAVFVPFFGVIAATITGVSRLARVTGAKVMPCVARMLPGGEGYVVTILPAWEDFPTDDVEADTRRVNAFIEAQALTMPEQYYWVHKRFKTRPEGETSPYS
ncbi:MAG: lipid A biosynthesis acyltransferase [Proteobacteria bacterium]|nr:lipid A biosynthesis acyltransferase [Pseudomonadota bacterium]